MNLDGKHTLILQKVAKRLRHRALIKADFDLIQTN